MDGIYPDAAGLSYLMNHLHITGIVSNHPKLLSLGKSVGLETIQRIFAVDSTGLETAIESVDTQYIDMLDLSPALVIPSLPTDLLSYPAIAIYRIGSNFHGSPGGGNTACRRGCCDSSKTRIMVNIKELEL